MFILFYPELNSINHLGTWVTMTRQTLTDFYGHVTSSGLAKIQNVNAIDISGCKIDDVCCLNAKKTFKRILA